jgi:glycolate oxidase FAD binding subunit
MAHGRERAHDIGSGVIATFVDSMQVVQALRERVADAAARRTPLRIVGAGTWLDGGRPVRSVPPARPLSIGEHSGIVDYVPGDLTLTARAGTTLAEIQRTTGEHGQWLALDPLGGDRGTIGATIATASAGPLATAFGTPRDLALGIELITGNGVIARGGGRVVKNVAGFDLTRLLTGSWGTLGVITEVTVRLHARPEIDETCAIHLAAGGAGRVRQLLRRLAFTPYACEVLNADMAHRLIGERREVALFRLGGNSESVAAQRAAVAELGDVGSVATNVWSRLRDLDVGSTMAFRASHLPSEIERTWREAVASVGSIDGALVHGTPSRGIVRCIVPASADATRALKAAFSSRGSSTRIGERLDAELWPIISPPPAGDDLSRGIKRTFDPASTLNPGILGELA